MCSRLRRSTPALNETEEIGAEAESYLASNNTLADSQFTVPNHLQNNVIVRHYVMQWDNSLKGLADNPHEATWTPVGGKHMELFGSKTRYAPNASKSAVRRGNLEQAILIGMKICKVSSNFPCELGLSVTGSKGNYYTADAQRYSYVIGSNERSNNLNQIVATTNPYVNSEYIRLYPGMTKDNLRTNGILHVPGENFVFVDKQHPIVEMMIENQDTLQIDIPNAQLIDDRWYKVSKTVTDRCIAELENELVDHLPLLDLSSFNANITRLHGLEWDDDLEICDGIDREDYRQKVLDAPRRASVVMELTYSFM